MEKANIAQLKNRLSHYLSRVKRGETVMVTERNSPVARIVPIPSPGAMDTDDERGWLKRMEAAGSLRPGRGRGVPEILASPPPGRKPVGAVRELLREREER
jgi:prevent-host-death family protein